MSAWATRLMGYGGYIPFGLEVYADYHFVRGLVGQPTKTAPPEVGPPEPA